MLNENKINELKEFVLENGKCKNGRTYPSVIEKNFPEIYNSIKGPEFKEKLYMLLYDIKEFPVCPVCGERLKLRNFSKGFLKVHKACLGLAQHADKEFASKVSSGKLKSHKREINLKKSYPDLDISYDYDKDEIVIKNYCRHEDIRFKNEKILKRLYKEKKCLCIKCNKEFIDYHLKTGCYADYDNSLKIAREIRKKYANVFSEDWFLRYYPELYVDVLLYTEKEKDIPFMERYIMFENKWHEIPECKLCHNKVKFIKTTNHFSLYCEDHINSNWESNGEAEIKQFLQDNNIDFISNDRKTISSELDIYIPDKKLAIEYNGLYYHNFEHKGKFGNYKKYYNKIY